MRPSNETGSVGSSRPSSSSMPTTLQPNRLHPNTLPTISEQP
jgi:hypothetical protein